MSLNFWDKFNKLCGPFIEFSAFYGNTLCFQLEFRFFLFSRLKVLFFDILKNNEELYLHCFPPQNWFISCFPKLFPLVTWVTFCPKQCKQNGEATFKKSSLFPILYVTCESDCFKFQVSVHSTCLIDWLALFRRNKMFVLILSLFQVSRVLIVCSLVWFGWWLHCRTTIFLLDGNWTLKSLFCCCFGRLFSSILCYSFVSSSIFCDFLAVWKCFLIEIRSLTWKNELWDEHKVQWDNASGDSKRFLFLFKYSYEVLKRNNC